MAVRLVVPDPRTLKVAGKDLCSFLQATKGDGGGLEDFKQRRAFSHHGAVLWGEGDKKEAVGPSDGRW